MVRGHLDFLLLGVLQRGAQHGYSLIAALHERSDGEFDMVDGLDIQTSGGFDTVKAHRRIRFFDTQERHFHAHQYVLRERISVELGERQVTLKFRHPDRYGDDDEDYRGTVTRDAHDIPLAMAEQLPLWVHPTPITKTAFVYG